MKKVLIFALLLLIIKPSVAQHQFNFDKSLYHTVPDSAVFFMTDTIPVHIGGISGICTTTNQDEYLLIADKASPFSGYFTANICLQETIDFRITSFTPFQNQLIEGEAIRMHPQSNELYITNEKDNSSEVIKINNTGKEEIFLWYSNYAKPMRFNSGYEGLCFSNDGNLQFVAIERPLMLPDEVHNNFSVAPVVPIIMENLSNIEENKTIFGYPIQGKEKGTGVSELLYRDENLLWAIERSYIKKENRNVVTIHAINMNNTLFMSDLPIEFHQITELVRPKLILDFEKGLSLKNAFAQPGNIEGACFSHDGKYLILITDNNYGNKDHTPTQIYALRLAE